MTVNLPVNENYTNPLGQFIGYDTLNNLLNTTLDNQKHIDIRGIVPSGLVTGTNNLMFYLDADNMAILDTYTMTQLDAASVGAGDNWTNGAIRPTSFLNGINTLQISCISGANTTSSTLNAVDLSSGFVSNDIITISLPNFPINSISTSASSISFYDGVNTQTLNFANSITPLASGNTQASFYYSSLTVLKPITITLNFTATSPCTVYVGAIRILSQTWTALSTDINTQGQFLRPSLSVSGTIPASGIPLAYRSDTPPGLTDPRPINSDFGVTFWTGSRNHQNTISMYFRERREALINQLDLDYITTATGTIGYTQGMLDALGHQPDFGESLYQPREQAQLDTLTQSQLNQYEQYQLERLWDVTDESYIQSQLTWNPDGTFTINLSDLQSDGTFNFSFTGSGISPYSYYLFETILEDTTATANIYPVTTQGKVLYTQPIFSTNSINNDAVFYREAGRIGWQISLGDGDAFVKGFNALDLMYAEYQSNIFNTLTPVKGASLTVDATPPLNLFTNITSWNGGTFALNKAIFNSSDGSIEITGTSTQGIITNTFSCTSLSLLKINFDLYVPAITLALDTPHFFLVNDMGYIYEFYVGKIIPNQWTTYEIIPVAVYKEPAGQYQFASATISASPVTWYIDNLSITQNVISWSGRSAPQDPWSPIFTPWIDFGDTLNNTDDGVVFSPVGTSLQVRGRAHAQTGIIKSIFITPQYAQLGNFTWND